VPDVSADNVICPSAFAGKPVVVNPKGHGTRKRRLRLCKDLSQLRRMRLEAERRQRETEENDRKRREEAAQRLADAPNTMELLTMFRRVLTLFSQGDRAHFSELFQYIEEVRARPVAPRPPAA
jgi:hypothetical protein